MMAISISSSDGYNNAHVFQTNFFRVQQVCGVESTTIISPLLSDLVYASNGNSVTGPFTTSKSNCPIVTISLLAASTPYFTLTHESASLNQE